MSIAQLAHQLAVVARVELGGEPLLQQRHAQLAQTYAIDVDARRVQAVERLTPPHRQCLAQPVSDLGVRLGQARLPSQLLTSVHVHCARGRVEQVPGVPGHQRVADLPAQRRDQALYP